MGLPFGGLQLPFRRCGSGWRCAVAGLGEGEIFVDFITSLGCERCSGLAAADAQARFELSSNIFGCADVDTLLPSLHWLYEAARRREQVAPGLLVDGGANVGRATARWIASLGDSFSRQMAKNQSQAPCVVCAGADAHEEDQDESPTVAVVAVEPSAKNFQLLLQHAERHAWSAEGFLPLEAALGAREGHAELAVTEDFAIDEVATLLWDPADPRPRQKVRVITLAEAVRQAQAAFPGFPRNDRIFLLKLDIEGLEPEVLRSLGHDTSPKVKFLSFEYASNVWKESLDGVIADLHRIGYFCFLITSNHLFPVSGPFWSNVYEVPMWSNFFCGKEGDRDLEEMILLHYAALGMWPRMLGTYLPDLAAEETLELNEARHRCLDSAGCAGVTCEGERCTLRKGTAGLRLSPADEVTYLRDTSYANLYLRYRREQMR
ncbi:unnamed protein product [Effrenium voratum]|nr:unnamed protein product [Effrenium voratum]